MKKTKIFSVALLLGMAALLLGVGSGAYEWPACGVTTQTEQISFCGVKGQPIQFSCDDLEFRMGAAEGTLRGITLTAVPKSGTLSLDGKALGAYDKLTRNEINTMTYLPAGDTTDAEIAFIPQTEESVKTTVAIRLGDQPNSAPVIENGRYSTTKNVQIAGKVSVYDAENDPVKIKILETAKKGEVVFTGTKFTYTPFLDVTGTDRFTFVCIDQAGNYSKSGVMELTIESGENAQVYLDMNNSAAYYSAVKLAEKGVYTGEKIGNALLFSPKAQVSRGEFLMLCIAACGYDRNLPACVNTGLTNDADIATWQKPYVKRGLEKGIITGSTFKPDQIPTRAEAVVMIARAAGMPNVKADSLKLTDRDEIPTWTVQAYMNLSAYKMLDLPDGAARPRQALTKDTAADLVWQLWKYHNTNPDPVK